MMPYNLRARLRFVRSRFRPGIPCRLGQRRVGGKAHFKSTHYRSLSWSRAVEVVGDCLAVQLNRKLPAPNITLMLYRCAYSLQIPISIANDCARAVYIIQNQTHACGQNSECGWNLCVRADASNGNDDDCAGDESQYMAYTFSNCRKLLSAESFDITFLVALLIRTVELRKGWQQWVLDHLPWNTEEMNALDIAALRNAFQMSSRRSQSTMCGSIQGV